MTDLAAPVTTSRARPAAARGDLSGIERSGGKGGRRLRIMLVGLDALAAALTWTLVLVLIRPSDWWWGLTRALPFGLFMSVLICLLARSQRLYQARVCVIRSTEVARLSRVAVVSGFAAFAIGRYGHILEPWVVMTGTTATFLAMVAARGGFSGWLKMSRMRGNFSRPVCIIGSNDEAEELVYLLRDHPELGYSVRALIGDSTEWAGRIPDLTVIALGDSPAELVRATGATGVVVAVSALSSFGRDRLISQLLADGIHVQLSAGLSRLGHSRMQASPLAHLTTFYVEPPQLSVGQRAIKRALDFVVASAILMATAPIVGIAALAIKLEDGGPVLYRQERVGLHGRRFEVLKLRTMVPDAGALLADLRALNEREGGPLFKLSSDPRVTRIGHFLRMSSIDELPQLVNVLRGEMSLVGPRPALPAEFEQFDSDLVGRAQVPPGITGLWQVEARDNPSFRVYRRLDLFYVENWSIAFDLAIMAGTARMLVGRTLAALWAPVKSRRSPKVVGVTPNPVD